MLRYIWKGRFDDRTFWAAVLSLVAKGLATLHADKSAALIRATPKSDDHHQLPPEEEILWQRLVRGHSHKDVVVQMLSPKAILAANDMSEALRQDATGRYFRPTRLPLIGGVALSVLAVFLVATPRVEQVAVLGIGLAIMAPGSFYLFFLVQRAWDILRAAQQNCDWSLLRREALVLAMLVPCLAGIVLGGVTLGGTFCWQVVACVLSLAVLNALFLQFFKFRTSEGRQVLTQIEGFRQFLLSVERLPMQRTDDPAEHVGVYEKYLPYALALEVEQAWGDRLVALSSTYHQSADSPGAESFYLGMWNGKPLEILYKPEAPKSGW